MNKVLILEPFYTNFHIDLANSLSKDIYSFVFNIGNYVYLRGAKKLLVHKQILNSRYSQADIFIAKNTKSLYSETLRKLAQVEPSESDFVYMAKYISFLRVFLMDKKIDLLLMHNDLRWQHALAIQVCKELGIRYLITERGLFRPDTMTVEFLGVNAYSSLPQDINFYHSLNIPSSSLKSYKVSRFTNMQVNIKFLLFILLNKAGDVFGINSWLVNKRYQMRNYFALFFKQKFTIKNSVSSAISKRYIFIPLQVNTDTQILVHSEYKNMQELISQVETTFYSLNSDLKLVFKVHPMEGGGSYAFDNRSIIIETDTKELINNSEFVITINSTVGFEAIQAYKKVIVLGSAFYKIEGVAVCSSIESFKDDLLFCLNNDLFIDKDLITKFICYLQSEYQINGNLFNYDGDTLKAIKRLLENIQ